MRAAATGLGIHRDRGRTAGSIAMLAKNAMMTLNRIGAPSLKKKRRNMPMATTAITTHAARHTDRESSETTCGRAGEPRTCSWFIAAPESVARSMAWIASSTTCLSSAAAPRSGRRLRPISRRRGRRLRRPWPVPDTEDAMSMPPSEPSATEPSPIDPSAVDPLPDPSSDPPPNPPAPTVSGAVRIPGEIWILVAAAFCVAIGYGIVAPVLPQYAAGFGVGVQAASAIVSVFAFARLVSAPGGGALVDRIGERRVYMLGLLIVALSTGAAAFAQTYLQLVVFRGLGGIGSAMFTVSAAALLVRLAPPSIRGRCSSAYGAAFLVGNIAGPVLGGLTAGLGYRVPFLIYAVMLLVATGVVALFLREARPAADGAAPTREVMRFAEALKVGAYRSALISGFANGWANFGIRVALIPLFAAAVPGLGVAWAGVALTVFAAGNAAALLVAGRGVDRYGRKPFLVIGFLVNGVATAVLGLSESIAMLVVSSLIAGVGSGMANPAQQAAVADIVSTDRNGGKVLAGFQMSQDLGAITGPLVAGGIAAAAGYGGAFALTGLVVVIGALVWLPVGETMPNRRRA